MMRKGVPRLRQLRPYNNLAFSGEGRKMTGFMTPYRAWMWKQQELWRNVHEAQFEHFRRVYKRQWLEAFRSNADEYIYKYNITKAHTLKQWEEEMMQQEEERVKQAQQAGARAALKAKHLDILKEYHERHFFQWYERASERLQYFSRMNWVQRDDIDAHIEKELNKYVRGKDEAYPLNFIGQMPMIEDEDGAVVEVPESMIHMHQAQFADTMPAEVYEPPQVLDADAVLREQISGAEQGLEFLTNEERQAMEEIVNMEESLAMRKTKVSRSEDATKEEIEIEKQKYLLKHAGGVGTKAFVKAMRPGKDAFTVAPDEAAGDAPLADAKGRAGKGKGAPGAAGVPTGKKQKTPEEKKKAPKTVRGEALDKRTIGAAPDVKLGEIAKNVPKLRISEEQFEQTIKLAEADTHSLGKRSAGPQAGAMRRGDAPTGKRRNADDDDDGSH